MSTPVIYVAGSYNRDWMPTMLQLLQVCIDVSRQNCAYLSPALWHSRDIMFEDNWPKYAEDIIPLSDAFLCTDRMDAKVQDEIRIAAQCEIPIFYTMSDLKMWLDYTLSRARWEK